MPEAVLTPGQLPGRPVLPGVPVLREGGGGEVLQSPKQDLQGERARRNKCDGANDW